MTPEEQALKASIQQRLEKLRPKVVNDGTGLRITVRGETIKLPFTRSAPVSTRNIS